MLHFIGTSYVKCLSRIDFEVVSRNLNSRPEIQVVQLPNPLAQSLPPELFTTPGSHWYPVTDVAVEWSDDLPGVSGNSSVLPDRQLFIRKEGQGVRTQPPWIAPAMRGVDRPWRRLSCLLVPASLDQLLLAVGVLRSGAFPPRQSLMVIVDYWVLLILEGKWHFKKGSPFIYSKWIGRLGLVLSLQPIWVKQWIWLEMVLRISCGARELNHSDWNQGTASESPSCPLPSLCPKGRSGPEPLRWRAGLLQTLYFSVEPLLGERSAALGEVRENEWWCPGSSGPLFPPKDPGSFTCWRPLSVGRPLACRLWWGLAVMSARCGLAPCLGFALRRSGSDGSFWAPRDTCPLDVSWGGPVDPCKRTNVNVHC